jgi:hypothetical protein
LPLFIGGKILLIQDVEAVQRPRCSARDESGGGIKALQRPVRRANLPDPGCRRVLLDTDRIARNAEAHGQLILLRQRPPRPIEALLQLLAQQLAVSVRNDRNIHRPQFVRG